MNSTAGFFNSVDLPWRGLARIDIAPVWVWVPVKSAGNFYGKCCHTARLFRGTHQARHHPTVGGVTQSGVQDPPPPRAKMGPDRPTQGGGGGYLDPAKKCQSFLHALCTKSFGFLDNLFAPEKKKCTKRYFRPIFWWQKFQLLASHRAQNTSHIPHHCTSGEGLTPS